MKQTDILLINPPFGTLENPYISIPVLASYLRSRNVKVSAFDANREFYFRFLTPANIRKGKDSAKKRFTELNNKDELTFPEMFEYQLLYRALTEAEAKKDDLNRLSFPFAELSDLKESGANKIAILLTTLPYFPEIIMTQPLMSVGSPFSGYSSSDIVKAARFDSFYSKLLEEMIGERLEEIPRIVGFSVVFPHQILPAFQCAYFVKKRFPQVHITMGGPFISIHMRDLKERRLFEIVDSLILDEGEIPLERLLIELSGKDPDLKSVPGLVYLSGGNICYNPSAQALDMKQSPPPDFNVFQLDRYLAKKEQLIIPFRLSKGCYWKRCSFCRTGLPMVKCYQQPPYEFLYGQLKQVVEETGIHNFVFSDESARPDVLEYISRRLIDENANINWRTHSRVDKELTRERCQLYRKAGCQSLCLGLESLNERILHLMKKGITVKLIEDTLIEIDSVLPIGAYMIVGFPTETEEEATEGYEKLEQFLKKGLIEYYHYSPFWITYGSDIWNHPEKYDIAEIYTPPGDDLMPNIYGFKSTGMSRQKAHELHVKLLLKASNMRMDTSPERLIANGHVLPLNYDLKGIMRKVHERLETMYLPVGRWSQIAEHVLPSR
jgi:radical SAM superfamily enzyme YgiQ (UPF0313 family)